MVKNLLRIELPPEEFQVGPTLSEALQKNDIGCESTRCGPSAARRRSYAALHGPPRFTGIDHSLGYYLIALVKKLDTRGHGSIGKSNEHARWTRRLPVGESSVGKRIALSMTLVRNGLDSTEAVYVTFRSTAAIGIAEAELGWNLERAHRSRLQSFCDTESGPGFAGRAHRRGSTGST